MPQALGCPQKPSSQGTGSPDPTTLHAGQQRPCGGPDSLTGPKRRNPYPKPFFFFFLRTLYPNVKLKLPFLILEIKGEGTKTIRR